jgi:hypothetical protein
MSGLNNKGIVYTLDLIFFMSGILVLIMFAAAYGQTNGDLVSVKYSEDVSFVEAKVFLTGGSNVSVNSDWNWYVCQGVPSPDFADTTKRKACVGGN